MISSNYKPSSVQMCDLNEFQKLLNYVHMESTGISIFWG